MVRSAPAVGSDAEQSGSLCRRLSAFGLPNPPCTSSRHPGSEWLPFALAGHRSAGRRLLLGAGRVPREPISAPWDWLRLWECTPAGLRLVAPERADSQHPDPERDGQRQPTKCRPQRRDLRSSGQPANPLVLPITSCASSSAPPTSSSPSLSLPCAFIFSWFSEFTLPAWAGLPALVRTTGGGGDGQAHSPYSVGVMTTPRPWEWRANPAFRRQPPEEHPAWFVFTSAGGGLWRCCRLRSQGEQLIQACRGLEAWGPHPAYTYREAPDHLPLNGDLLHLDRLKARPDLGLRGDIGADTPRRHPSSVGIARWLWWGWTSGGPALLAYDGGHSGQAAPRALAAVRVTAPSGTSLLPVSARLSAVKPLERDRHGPGGDLDSAPTGL